MSFIFSEDLCLTGRVALVTGGSNGIGLMIAKSLAKHGAKVYITGTHVELLSEASTATWNFVGCIIPVIMDMTEESSFYAVARDVQVVDGKLDILVNNASRCTVGNQSDFSEQKLAAVMEGRDLTDPETFQGWEDIFRLNFIAPFFVIKAFMPLLIQGAQSRVDGTSAVINMTSVAATGRTVIDFSSFAYGPSKAALNHLTSQLATHFAKHGIRIRCNAIQPGAFLSSHIHPKVLEEFKTKPFPGYVAPIPLMRLGCEEDIERAVVFLAASDYTNGVFLTVDGGLSLVNP